MSLYYQQSLPGREVALPLMYDIHQEFESHQLSSVSTELKHSLSRSLAAYNIQPGMLVAVAVGSRGITGLALIVTTVVDYLHHVGARPIVVAAMGSHGGASTSGQLEVLANYGIRESTVHAPVVASTESCVIGSTDTGIAVYLNKEILRYADAVVPIARIKPHTNFQGPIQSGIHKMIAVGLGGPRGAASIHKTPFNQIGHTIVAAANIVMKQAKILFAVAIVEDAYDNIGVVEVVDHPNFRIKEEKLLQVAKSWLPSIPIASLDVLIVQEMGKNISGSGMDPNIVGRGIAGGPSAGLDICRIVVLSLTAETHGNAAGMGRADIVTKRLVDEIDWNATYRNHLTSRMLELAKLPMVAATDYDAIQIAIDSLYGDYMPDTVRLAWIRNTAQVADFRVSPAVLGSMTRPVVNVGVHSMKFSGGLLQWTEL